jgi:hypothetical protein
VALQFDLTSLSQQQRVLFLEEVSKRSSLHEDKIKALYTILGDDLFFTLAMLAGDEIRFLSQRELRSIYLAVSRTGENYERKEN